MGDSVAYNPRFGLFGAQNKQHHRWAAIAIHIRYALLRF